MNEFLEFLNECPTQFHVCSFLRKYLIKFGFVEVKESEFEKIDLAHFSKKAFLIRDEREIIAWNDNGHNHSIIVGSHTDSPCLILKPKYDEVVNGMRRCRSSIYGNGLWYLWMDRDLRLAGRVFVKKVDDNNNEFIKSVLYDSKVGVATIPSCDLSADENLQDIEINTEINLIPIYGLESNTPPLIEIIAKHLNVNKDDIISMDLHFIDADPPLAFNSENSYLKNVIHSQRLDDLHNIFAIVNSFVSCEPENGCLNMISLFDNEEIGNKTHTAVNSNLILMVLLKLIQNNELIRVLKANSLFINCYSSHAQYPLASSESNGIYHNVRLGNGICLHKTTDFRTSNGIKNDYAIHRAVEETDKPIQMIPPANKKTKKGSKIGILNEDKTSIPSIDIALPLIGMHSIREICSYDDIEEEIKILSKLFSNFSKYKYPL